MPAVVTGQHLGLLFEGRVADQQLEHEPVELRLGQRVGALVLDRVLCGDHDERVGQRAVPTPSAVTWRSSIASSSAACVLGGVRLISSARNRFVKTGPSRNRKPAVAVGIEHQLARHVRRHQVGGELHPGEVEVERLGQGLDQQRLGHAGHALQQDVAPHQQRGDEAGQRAVLADHDLADLLAQREDRGTRVAALGRRLHRWGHGGRGWADGAGGRGAIGWRHAGPPGG